MPIVRLNTMKQQKSNEFDGLRSSFKKGSRLQIINNQGSRDNIVANVNPAAIDE